MAAVIAGAVRLAIGSFGGTLSNTHVTDIGAEVLKQALNRAGVEAGAIQEIIMGNVVQAGAGMNPADRRRSRPVSDTTARPTRSTRSAVPV